MLIPRGNRLSIMQRCVFLRPLRSDIFKDSVFFLVLRQVVKKDVARAVQILGDILTNSNLDPVAFVCSSLLCYQ